MGRPSVGLPIHGRSVGQSRVDNQPFLKVIAIGYGLIIDPFWTFFVVLPLLPSGQSLSQSEG